jgi:putative flippase GtrA
VPVDWIDDADSRVDIVSTALADLRGIVRMIRTLSRGRLPIAAVRQQLGRSPLSARGPGLVAQVLRFGCIGVVSTIAYLLLYVVLRTPIGAQPANFVALLLTAIANTAANRRLTFGVTGRQGSGRQQLQGLVAFGICLALTSGSLAALHAVEHTPARATELTLLVLSNLVATVLRFVLLRWWVFRTQRA